MPVHRPEDYDAIVAAQGIEEDGDEPVAAFRDHADIKVVTTDSVAKPRPAKVKATTKG